MRKFLIITGCIVAIAGCKGKNNPGSTYMPDMYYSRAFETYAGYDTSKFTMERNAWSRADQSKIYYTYQPVAGTIARGDMAAFPYTNDTSGYKQSAAFKSQIDTASIDFVEAERLYLVNCGICHGTKLDGNGPLWKDGNGPYPAAPKNLKGDDMKALADGTMFHVITYGKGQMGSYASQLNTSQRWMVIAYIRQQQAGGAAKATTDSTATAKTDSAAVATKM